MTPFRSMTLADKLASLSVALLVVAGLSVTAGTLVHGEREDAKDGDALHVSGIEAPLLRVEALVGEDVIFHPAELIDENRARTYENALRRSEIRLERMLERQERLIVAQEARLEALNRTFIKVADRLSMPDVIREKMLSEVALQMRDAEKRIGDALVAVQELELTRGAGTAAVARPPLPPLPGILTVPTPRNYSCDESGKDAEKRSKKKTGREGFLEALSLV